ncbi:hypothetical protein HGA91_06645 [candidate division WWE3 bacterium]|nr:hypothetical protein [candidate division WWE3 bacterium]
MLTVANRSLDVSRTGTDITLTAGFLNGAKCYPQLTLQLSVREAYEFMYRLKSCGVGSLPQVIRVHSGVPGFISIYPALNGLTLNLRYKEVRSGFEIHDIFTDIIDLHLVGPLSMICRQLPLPRYKVIFDCREQLVHCTSLLMQDRSIIETISMDLDELSINLCGRIWSIKQILQPIAVQMVDQFSRHLRPIRVLTY